MKKILSVHQPIVATYTSYGAIFSILPESALSWVMNNFIQIHYVYDWDIVTFDGHKLLMSNCPSIDYFNEEGNYCSEEAFSELKEKIIQSIDMDEYLYIYVDRFFVECSDFYQKYHMPHEIFIYGYDLTADIVYVGDNLRKGKFVFDTCSFYSILKAYCILQADIKFFKVIRKLRVCENTTCNLNINQIKYGLEVYLNSSETYTIVGEPSKMNYGIGIIDNIAEQILNNKGEDIDIRFFHLLYEHKLLMEMRVKYLIRWGRVDKEKINVKNFETIKGKAMILRNMVLKYNLSKRGRILSSIHSRLCEIKAMDVALLSALLDYIE